MVAPDHQTGSIAWVELSGFIPDHASAPLITVDPAPPRAHSIRDERGPAPRQAPPGLETTPPPTAPDSPDTAPDIREPCSSAEPAA